MVELYMLPARQGDFLWLHYGKEGDFHNIIIDGGTATVKNYVKETFEHIFRQGETIDAVFLTHIDDDHIAGLLHGMLLLNPDDVRNKIGSVYINTGRAIREHLLNDKSETTMDNYTEKGTEESTEDVGFVEDSIEIEEESNNYGVNGAIKWVKFLETTGLNEATESGETRLHEYTIMGEKISIGGATLHVISPGEEELMALLEKKWDPYLSKHPNIGNYDAELPDEFSEDLSELMNVKLKKDTSVNNNSSIAFIFTYEDVRLALLGDANAQVCEKGLKECGFTEALKVDALKLAHHGSNYNTSDALLQALPTDTYMISSNGLLPNGKPQLPNKVTIAHLIREKADQQFTLLCNYDWNEKTYSRQFFNKQDRKVYLNKQMKYIILDNEKHPIKEGLDIYGEWR